MLPVCLVAQPQIRLPLRFITLHTRRHQIYVVCLQLGSQLSGVITGAQQG